MTRLAWREWAATGILLAAASWGLSCGSLPPSTGDGGRALGGQDDDPDGGTLSDQPVADGGAPDGDGGTSLLSCSDLFDETVVQTYSVDITAADWAKLQAEFNDIPAVLTGAEFQTYHPVTFHFGAETVTDAAIRLKGQSSWVQTVELDQPHPKMQFDISFDQVDPNKAFHGISKLVFDMPRSDLTFLHQRLANNWLREVGITAPCANSARVIINGAYYGVYVAQEGVGHHLLKEFFPLNSNGDLLKGGVVVQTNKLAPNAARKAAFWAATDIASMEKVVDLQGSVLEWAADALLNNGDGYYGGAHNFFIYDQGAPGWVWLPTDMDSTFDWLGFFDDHPIYWWEQRHNSDKPGPHWLVVMNDPTWRGHYVEAIRTQLQHWDVAEFQTRIDTWSKQIADAVNTDPNKAATYAQFQSAVALARQIVAERPAYMESFLDCEDGKGGADQDGDGVRWCNDCRDDLASVHPGAPEACNGIDDNCNGVVDEGCGTTP